MGVLARLLGILILYAILAQVQPLAPVLPWLMLVLVIWALTRKRVLRGGMVNIPTASGEKVLLRAPAVRFYLANTRWQRSGGGLGIHYGRRVGRKGFGGVSAWSSGSTSTREEYLRRFEGGAMLTDRRLFLLDGKSYAARLVIPVTSIASISMVGRRRNRITVSWGATSPKTAILEFRSLVKGGAEESAGQWLRAFHELTTEVGTSLTQTPVLT